MLRVIDCKADKCTVFDDDDFTVETVSKEEVKDYENRGGSITLEEMPTKFKVSGNGFVLYDGKNRVSLRLLSRGGIELYKTVLFLPKGCEYDIEINSLEETFYVITVFYSVEKQLFSKMLIVTKEGKVVREDETFQREVDLVGYKYRNGVLLSKY